MSVRWKYLPGRSEGCAVSGEHVAKPTAASPFAHRLDLQSWHQGQSRVRRLEAFQALSTSVSTWKMACLCLFHSLVRAIYQHRKTTYYAQAWHTLELDMSALASKAAEEILSWPPSMLSTLELHLYMLAVGHY